MTWAFYNRDYKEHSTGIGDETYDGIFTDPPYNISDYEHNFGEETLSSLNDRRPIRRDMGEWDKYFDPSELVAEAERILKPGGWFVACSGDMTFPIYHTLIKESEWLHYRATITWVKTNPPPNIRQRNFTFSFEWMVVATKGDRPMTQTLRRAPSVISLKTLEDLQVSEEATVWEVRKRLESLDKSTQVAPLAWNYMGSNPMRNVIEGPLCMGNERIYWHIADSGRIVRCDNPQTCAICGIRGKDDRINHPTQKPKYVWNWLYEKMTRPDMWIFDPFAGLASSGIAAQKYGLHWVGTEIDPTYFEIGASLLEGRWEVHEEQETLFDQADFFGS